MRYILKSLWVILTIVIGLTTLFAIYIHGFALLSGRRMLDLPNWLSMVKCTIGCYTILFFALSNFETQRRLLKS